VAEAGLRVTEWHYYFRDALRSLYAAETGFRCNQPLPAADDVLVCNASAIILAPGIIPEVQDCAVYCGSTLVCARLSRATMDAVCRNGSCDVAALRQAIDALQKREFTATSSAVLVPEYIWNLVLCNSDIIRRIISFYRLCRRRWM
jgi:hypothetical protein